MSVVVNAKIRSTLLGLEDHGILTCYLYLDYGGASQGFGGYVFDSPVFGPSGRNDFRGRVGTAYGMEYIRRVLDVVGVEKWESLPGQIVRVRKESDYGAIEALGNALEDKWLDPKALAAEYTKERA